MELGPQLHEFRVEPVSGRALPLSPGQVLRIEQVTGAQCVDFNCFSLADYKERMSVGMMRRRAFHAQDGDFIISSPPRSRLMMQILSPSPSCVIDTLGSRCSADMFEASYGFEWHTNCQDTLAETIREFRLTPDDTHDCLNFWMRTTWDPDGRWETKVNDGLPGDSVDLLALMDVLAVPVTCGSGDISGVSNYTLAPIVVRVFDASPATRAAVEATQKRYGKLRNQRVPEDGNSADRALVRDPTYRPNFGRYPIRLDEIELNLGPDDQRNVARLERLGLGSDAAAAIRHAVFDELRRTYARPSPFADPILPSSSTPGT